MKEQVTLQDPCLSKQLNCRAWPVATVLPGDHKRHDLTLEPDGSARASAMPATSGIAISAAAAGDRAAAASAARTTAAGDPTSATWLLHVAAKEVRVPLDGKAAA